MQKATTERKPKHQEETSPTEDGGEATRGTDARLLAQRRRFEAAEATLGAPILGISKAALIDIQRQWLSEPCEIVTALRDVPAEREGALPLVEGHVITVLSKVAGEVFHAVVDGKFTIVDVVIPEGWYAGSDNDAFGRQGIFPAAACGEPVDCHADASSRSSARNPPARRP